MSKLKPLEQIESQWLALDRPESGEKYQHYKGGVCEIVATGFLEDSEVPCIVYRSTEKNIIWVRSAKNFLENVEYKGVKVPRFKRV